MSADRTEQNNAAGEDVAPDPYPVHLLAIALDQRRFVLSFLRREVKNFDRYEPGDPAPYINCRPWGALTLIAGVYNGDDRRLRRMQDEEEKAIRWTLKKLAADREITLYRADGIIAGVWLGQPLGNSRAKVPIADREIVLERDRRACVLCGATDDLTIDHIFPVVHGGSGDPINLRVLCRSCNCRKGAAIPPEILRLGAE